MRKSYLLRINVENSTTGSNKYATGNSNPNKLRVIRKMNAENISWGKSRRLSFSSLFRSTGRVDKSVIIFSVFANLTGIDCYYDGMIAYRICYHAHLVKGDKEILANTAFLYFGFYFSPFFLYPYPYPCLASVPLRIIETFPNRFSATMRLT